MTYNFQFVHLSVSERLKDLVFEKLDPLGEKLDWIINADIFFKVENDTKGKGKICEIRLSVPGPRIFASSNEETLETAVIETVKDLKKLLIKRKDEMKAH